MTFLAKPKLHHPDLHKNALGYTRRDYEGAISTLCAGCGHDFDQRRHRAGVFRLDLPPHRIAKLSGIGCSSKTPTYFLGASHGFNSVHGRMPSVLTGANLANRDLIYLGVSGDGDSASIGLGQFAHAMRRGVNMVYIVENNGVYGLTKGQFSATSDKGAKSKRGVINSDEPIDLVGMALQLGATFVARSFSGDKAQLVPLIEAALAPRGRGLHRLHLALRGFQQPRGSTKSFDFVREHNEAVNSLDVITGRERNHRRLRARNGGDGDAARRLVLRLRKLHADYDVHDRIAALAYCSSAMRPARSLPACCMSIRTRDDMHAHLNTVDTPLNELGETELCPGAAALDKLNASLR